MNPGQTYVMPASPAQVGLWLLVELDPTSTAYSVPAAMRLTGPLDTGAFERALHALCVRHESLRTTFTVDDGTLSQVVHPEPALRVDHLDLSAHDDAAAACREELARRAAVPFDLRQGPLLRAVVVRLGADDHVVSLLLHHIVTDGWSMGVLVRELAVLYAAETAGAGNVLDEPGLQYADFAVWHHEWLDSGVRDEQLAFWKAELADEDALLDLPADRARPAVPAFRGARVARTLALEAVESVRESAGRHGGTLFMAAHAAFAAVLAKNAAQSEIRIGVPIAGRDHPGTQDVLGFFANTVVIRTEWTRDLSFGGLLGQVRDRTVRALAHADVPFGDVVRALGAGRDRSRSPLFQAMVSMDNAPGGFDLAPGLTAHRFELPTPGAKFDLTLFVHDGPGGLELALEYAADLYASVTAQRLIDQVADLLRAGTENPDRPLGDLLTVTADQRRRLAQWGAGPAVAPDAPATVLELFYRQVAKTPHAVAVVDGARTLTYAELDASAERIAAGLERSGVGRAGLVAVAVPRSAELVAALLAVWKRGAAYLPLDPAQPAARLAAIAADARPVAVLETAGRGGAVAPGVPAVDVHRLLGAEPAEPAESAESAAPAAADGADPAYVLYTSGSTGRPKGVQITQSGLVAYVTTAAEEYSPAQAPVAPLHTTVGFDLTVTSLWVPLGAGGTVHLVDENDSVQGLADLLRGPVRPNLVKLTPAHLEALCGLLPAGSLRGLRACFVAGGEALKPGLVRRWFAVAPDTEVVNEYGPTETVVGCVVERFTAGDDLGERPGLPIGRPLRGTCVHVVDERLEPVAPGLPGELLIGGACVAPGYLGNPVQTARAFLPDPFSGVPGARVYRTGDLVRYLPDGRLEFLGRRDHQVKVRGQRIELAEVEAGLRAVAGVTDAVVVTDADHRGRTRLIGYVTGADDADAVRGAAAALLPDAMVPSAVVCLDALPLTTNGKIDRAVLPAPADDARIRSAHVPPATGTEQMIAEIWSEVLAVDAPGRDDDFFALGGHSLAATRVVARLRERLGAELPLRTVFAAPTLRALAAEADAAASAQPQDGTAHSAPAQTAGTDEELSFAQQRLWFLDQMDPGSALYNVPAALRLRGALDVPALHGALDDVLARHDVLRTAFRATGEGEARAVVEVGVELPLPLTDLSALDEAEREQKYERRAAAQARTAFDLAAPPLLRLELLRLAEQDHVLLVTVHHIVSDGWSVGVLLRDLAELYRARLTGAPAVLPALPLRYADHARRQRDLLAGGALDGQLAYWRDRLAGPLPVLDLPADRPRTAGPRTGAQLLATLDAELTAKVTQFSQERQLTPYITLLSAFYAFLHQHTGQEDVVVGSPVAQRTRTDTEHLVGCFVNVLALRTAVRGSASFEDLLHSVKDTAIAAYDHQDVPFEELVKDLDTDRDQTRTPVFQVMFGLQNTPAAHPDMPGLDVGDLPVHSGTSRFDVTLLVEPVGDTLRLRLEYDTGLFDPATAERFLDRYRTLLAAAVADAHRPVAALPMLDDAEEALLRAGHNARDLAFPVEHSFPELFAEQARRTPQSVAVVDGAGSFTYAELDRAADDFAAGLRALGVRGGESVALLVERGTGFLTAMLGTFKAGAAYVPLDPLYPAPRLARILAGSRARLAVHTDGTAELTDAVCASADGAVRAASLDEILATGRDVAPEDRSWPAPTPADLAYTIFTSGSTGAPKGAMVEQAGMVNHLYTKVVDLGMTGGDVLVQNASACFDISVWQFLTPLLLGGTVIVVDDERAHDPALLWGAAAAHDVTLLETVPSMLRAALADPALPEINGLRSLVLTGEALPAGLVRAWLARPPEIPIVNAYGPTECSDDITHAVLDRAPAPGDNRTPIGRPVPNMRLYVMDSRERLAPLGVPGELWAGGIGVGRGYLGEPALTAQKFVPDPFGKRPGGRLYRTGDLARWRTDGSLEFLGRIDHQMKIRGHRTEPGEIEAALRRHPAVEDCAVSALPDPRGETRLVAYVVGAGLPPGAELRAHAAELVGVHLAPGHFVELDALPLNSNGKVDRNALPAPDWTAGAPAPEHVPPRDETERAVARAWADVLGVDRVGATDHFFDLGGHSLLAVRVLARLRTALGHDIALRTLFEAPVVEDFATRLRATDATEGPAPADGLTPIAASAPGGREPLSAAQQRMWYFEQRSPGGYTLNMAGAYRIRGPLSPHLLASALTGAVARHDTLRTVYGDVDGVPYSRVLDPEPVVLPVHDLRPLDAAAREQRLAGLAAQESTTAFDLAGGPLLRAALARVDEEDWTLFITVHHLAADGSSVTLLLQEVLDAYAAEQAGTRAQFTPAARYADWARRERDQLDDASGASHRRYWQEQLAGELAVLELPADRPRGAEPAQTGALVATTLAPERAERLRALAKDRNATVFMVLLAAFQATLHRITGDTDVIVGTPVDGRAHPDVERTIGCFINTLPIRGAVDPERGFDAMLGQVRDTVLDAFAHQDYPFERMVADLPAGRDRTHSPVFQVLFNMLDPHDPLAAHTGSGLDVAPYGTELLRFGAKFDLNLYARDQQGKGIELTAVYSSELFDEDRITDLLERLVALLDAVTREPGRPLGALAPLRTARDAALPDPAEPLPAAWHGGLLARLAHRAARTPDAPAVDDGRTRWTYGRLAEAVAATAAELREHGVGEGDVVAVLGERRAPLPAALLAVLARGAAFVVLDPAHPAAALRERAEAAGAALLLVPGLAADPVAVVDPEPGADPTAVAGLLPQRPVLHVPDDAASHEGSPAPHVTDAAPELPDRPAYLAFTSGTTGTPRAVSGTQRALTHFLDWHTERHGLGADDRFSALSGPGHDPFLRDLFTPLWCGGELCLPDAALVRDPDALAHWLAEQRISVAHLTPSLARLLAAAGADAELPALRRAFFGGEPLGGDTCAQLAERAPQVRCTAFYGATETPQAMAVQDVDLAAARRHRAATVPVGRGITGVQILVLRADRTVAGVGELGEIAVRTPYLSLGYPHDADLTRERFPRTPGAAPDDRMYLTGDLGRYRPDGGVEFAGRADRQLKILGHRVEPAEIEARLTRHPSVAEARVVADSGTRLVAHLAPQVGRQQADAQDLAQWCRDALPAHLVPAAFEWWERLPLTPNGKTDTAALAARSAPRTEYVAPATDAEHAVHAIWQEILPHSTFGVRDDFFAVGGHSLAAAQVLARVRRDFDVDIPLDALFRATTVADLALLVEESLMAQLDDLTDDEIAALLTEEDDQ